MQNNQATQSDVESFEAQERCHEIRMKRNHEEEEESLTFEDFEEEILAIQKKGKHNYDDVLKAGEGLKAEVFNFLNMVWKTENIPRKWDLTTLKQIFKRGNRNCLDSYRWVHLKHYLPRLFDGLILNKIKPNIISAMSKFQIGAKPGHRPQEHIFVFKSVVELSAKLKLPLLTIAMEISKYFYKHTLLEEQ